MSNVFLLLKVHLLFDHFLVSSRIATVIDLLAVFFFFVYLQPHVNKMYSTKVFMDLISLDTIKKDKRLYTQNTCCKSNSSRTTCSLGNSCRPTCSHNYGYRPTLSYDNGCRL